MGSDAEEGSKHFNIGDNLRHKAFYEDSIDELSRALHLLEGELGPEDLAVAKAHYSLGLSFRATKNYKQGMQHLIKAADIYENLDKSKYEAQIKSCKINLARTHHSYGVDLQRSGDYDSSLVEHRKAVAIREAILGRSHLETARSYYVMGCALSDRGDFDEALGDLRRALRIRLLVFGKDHLDTLEVVDNIATVLYAKGKMSAEGIAEYKSTVLSSLELENEGDACLLKEDYKSALIFYRKGLKLEEKCLGDLHPTTCDLYLRMADALTELGDLEASLIEYKSAITINERMLGKFHVNMANIYSKLAGMLMDRGEYDAALSFYCKAYGIFDATLGLHDDTKQALLDVKLAAEKSKENCKSSDILWKVEKEFKKRHPSVSGGTETFGLNGDDNEDEADDGDAKKKKKKGVVKKKKKKKDDQPTTNKENKINVEEFDVI
ncbi:tetratricopeptide repeat protein [Nitzschia inconspicua]|uniref:Tetratricopeptide repeat protein n=1 Tax=Nitzschia inconspicua TaxID=303405 RepID=A0A9K3L1V4_9STRA|nr:tetratricopeptide repeat protein [Nitzschia inconspicua]